MELAYCPRIPTELFFLALYCTTCAYPKIHDHKIKICGVPSDFLHEITLGYAGPKMHPIDDMDYYKSSSSLGLVYACRRINKLN